MIRSALGAEIVRAGQLDLPVLAALHRAVFGDPASPDTGERWDETFFSSLMTGPGVFGWVASVGGDPAGFALGRTAAQEAEILTIGVRPDRRGQGIGAALLARLVEHCRSAGVEALYLEVATDNASALALYRRAGFTTVGTRKGYYRRGRMGVDAAVMRLDLA